MDDARCRRTWEEYVPRIAHFSTQVSRDIYLYTRRRAGVCWRTVPRMNLHALGPRDGGKMLQLLQHVWVHRLHQLPARDSQAQFVHVRTHNMSNSKLPTCSPAPRVIHVQHQCACVRAEADIQSDKHTVSLTLECFVLSFLRDNRTLSIGPWPCPSSPTHSKVLHL